MRRMAVSTLSGQSAPTGISYPPSFLLALTFGWGFFFLSRLRKTVSRLQAQGQPIVSALQLPCRY